MASLSGRRILYGLMVLLLIGIGAYAALFAQRAGLMRALSPTEPGSCSDIAGFLGPEDMAVDQARGIAFIPRADRFGVAMRGAPPMGGIDLLDLAAEHPERRTLSPLPEADFFPHGLDLWTGPEGERRLFAVNHGRSGDDHSVAIFTVGEDNSLSHVETIRSDRFVDPNDLVAVGPRQFYVTNLYGSKSEGGRLLESYLMLPRANLLFYDGRDARIVADGLAMANGVTASADQRTIYVAEVIARAVTAFRREADDGLTELWRETLPMGIDNLTRDAEGALWAAGHPKLLEISARMRDEDRVSASEVIRLDPETRQQQTIWQDRGKGLSAASVAVRYGDRLFIGAVFGETMRLCGPVTAPHAG